MGGSGTWSARSVLAVASLLLAPVGPWVGPGGATHLANDPGCGDLSPAGNACNDPTRVRMSNDPVPAVAVLGFEGRILIRLDELADDDDDGGRHVVWACDALFAAPTVSCGIVDGARPPKAGKWVVLSCHAVPHPLFLGLVLPAGPWGCEVDM